MTTTAETIDPNEIQSLVQVTRRLTDLMTAELVALRAMRPKDITPILAEKTELTGQYEARLRSLKQRRHALKALDPKLLAELKAATETLNEVMADNRRALGAAREVNAKLIKVIADEVSRQRNPAGAYTREARMERVGRAARSAGPIQFDERA